MVADKIGGLVSHCKRERTQERSGWHGEMAACEIVKKLPFKKKKKFLTLRKQ